MDFGDTLSIQSAKEGDIKIKQGMFLVIDSV